MTPPFTDLFLCNSAILVAWFGWFYPFLELLMANSFRNPRQNVSINPLFNLFVHARVLTLKTQSILPSEAFLPAGIYLSSMKSFCLFSSHILAQHTINLHINDKLLIFLSLEICLTGTVRGLDGHLCPVSFYTDVLGCSDGLLAWQCWGERRNGDGHTNSHS